LEFERDSGVFAIDAAGHVRVHDFDEIDRQDYLHMTLHAKKWSEETWPIPERTSAG
jgi:hypothetical protein